MEIVKVGIIGLGNRGSFLIRDTILPMADKARIIAVCDVYADRVKAAADQVEQASGERPFETEDYREILKMDTVDAVVIATSWETHVDIAVDAMKAGKYVGMEVGGACSVEDCWRLVDTYEETKTECMFLENCCYGKRELMVLNMVRQGVMGEIVHCAGGYLHDLREEIAFGEENRHYRLNHYLNRNGENYPTHELGPIAKLLDINNGNRMLSLTSTASAAKGMHEYVVQQKGEDHPLSRANFRQGDVVTTVITCENGQTIVLTLDTTLARYYSRGFTVRGTKGSYWEDTDSVYLEAEHKEVEWSGQPLWGNAESYEENYLHPLWKEFDPKGGHGGMDWVVFSAFFDAVQRGAHPPIDVYDAAAYMCITALSEQSIEQGSAPMAIPDFTRGRWQHRIVPSDGVYVLDRV